MSAYLLSERSVCLTEAECQGKCLWDCPRDGICLPDKESQGICLLNAVYVLQMQSVKAYVIQTRSVSILLVVLQGTRVSSSDASESGSGIGAGMKT